MERDVHVMPTPVRDFLRAGSFTGASVGIRRPGGCENVRIRLLEPPRLGGHELLVLPALGSIGDASQFALPFSSVPERGGVPIWKYELLRRARRADSSCRVDERRETLDLEEPLPRRPGASRPSWRSRTGAPAARPTVQERRRRDRRDAVLLRQPDREVRSRPRP